MPSHDTMMPTASQVCCIRLARRTWVIQDNPKRRMRRRGAPAGDLFNVFSWVLRSPAKFSWECPVWAMTEDPSDGGTHSNDEVFDKVSWLRLPCSLMRLFNEMGLLLP